MRILLICAAGMSTSLLVNKMKQSLGPEEETWVIEAKPVERFQNIYQDFDVILLGPQIRYRKAELKKIADGQGIPLDIINTMDYGLCNGEKVLDFAKELYNNRP